MKMNLNHEREIACMFVRVKGKAVLKIKGKSKEG